MGKGPNSGDKLRNQAKQQMYLCFRVEPTSRLPKPPKYTSISFYFFLPFKGKHGQTEAEL